MSTIELKHINMTLDPRSIQRAIKEIESFNKNLKTALDELCKHMLDEGVKIAKIRLLGYGVEKGPLYDSIKQIAFDPQTGVGYIRAGEGLVAGGKSTDMSYAIFVEYGTGVFKKQAEEKNASPFAPKLNLPNKKQEDDRAGWVYFNRKKNKFYFTRGQKPKPFMLNTMIELQMLARNKGSSMLLEYLPKG